MFYGLRLYGGVDGAPTPCRVFFPSLDGNPESAPPLLGCGTYSLVVLCHGHCDSESFKAWYELPAELARSGFVVLVPAFPGIGAGTNPSSPESGDLAVLDDAVGWLRTQWEFRDLLRGPKDVGVFGHSFGGLLATLYAGQGKAVALATLGAVFGEWTAGTPNPLSALTIPKFIGWGSASLDLIEGYADLAAEWGGISIPKHSARFAETAHWDYLPAGRSPCEEIRGDCPITHAVGADLVTLFFSKYLPSSYWPNLNSCIPDSLVPPVHPLSNGQKFYAGLPFQALRAMTDRPGCGVTLTWDTASSSGTRTIP